MWARGETDSAFTNLEKAYSEGSDTMAILRVYPPLEPLRSDARFEALMAKVKRSSGQPNAIRLHLMELVRRSLPGCEMLSPFRVPERFLEARRVATGKRSGRCEPTAESHSLTAIWP